MSITVRFAKPAVVMEPAADTVLFKHLDLQIAFVVPREINDRAAQTVFVIFRFQKQPCDLGANQRDELDHGSVVFDYPGFGKA